jgi:hypothetical protein
VGQIFFEDGLGPKTLSAAGGGAILWLSQSPITWANAGTTLRVSVMDTEASGYEDGTPDVYGTLVPGVNTLTTLAWQTTLMTSGSKTMNDGDLIAVQLEMTSLGGSDSVLVQRTQGTFPFSGWPYSSLPHGVSDTGSGFTKSTLMVPVVLRFDDGTYGWMTGHPLIGNAPVPNDITKLSFGSSSSPDECGAAFSLSFRATVSGVLLQAAETYSTSACEVSVLSDPWGTPTAIPGMPIAYNAEAISSIGGVFGGWILTQLPTPLTVEPNVEYAVPLRPTTTNVQSLGVMDLGSGYGFLKRMYPYATLKTVGRTNQTGAFTEIQPHYMPVFGLMLSHLEDGL